ncbi:hypothetical protein ALC62_00505 [Cyphomyrmex costatus]|uniref:Uncharacterized protein n=1 Tax=Cyphomyrmex costatus TaxID=456900 RepID=A0A195D6N1_9HYME|nr:hypothetical protein ALC62_00505 [Cyphomyrmex costatus]
MFEKLSGYVKARCPVTEKRITQRYLKSEQISITGIRCTFTRAWAAGEGRRMQRATVSPGDTWNLPVYQLSGATWSPPQKDTNAVNATMQRARGILHYESLGLHPAT